MPWKKGQSGNPSGKRKRPPQPAISVPPAQLPPSRNARQLGTRPTDMLRELPPGWRLQVRRAGGFTHGDRVFPYGSCLDAASAADALKGKNVPTLLRLGMLVMVPPGQEAGPASAPRDLPPPRYAKPNPKVTVIEVFGDPISSWRKSVAATAATLDDGSHARAYDLLLGDARGYAIYQKANAQNYADQTRRLNRPGGPIRPL
jgi:hypothetical protein